MPRRLTRRGVLVGAGAGVAIGATAVKGAVAAPAALSDRHADVCVIGAGFAGLSAAYRLKKDGLNVVVLEARERVGGRSWTRSMNDGAWVDWGGQWVGKDQNRFYDLIAEMGCKTYPTPGTGLTLQRVQRDLTSDKLERIPDDDDMEDPAPIKALYAEINALAAKIDVERPWTAPGASLHDSVTFAQWLRLGVSDAAVRRYAGVEVGSVPSSSTEEISMLQLGWLINSCHRLDMLFGFAKGAQKDRVIGGTQPVAQRVAEKLGDSVVLGQPVRRIEWSANGAVVHSDKLTVKARCVIVAIPPHLAGAIEYEPSLPTNRVQVTQRWPQGLVIKVSMVYSEPFWHRIGLSGKSFDYKALISETADSSTPPEYSKAGILTGFVYAESARIAAMMPPEKRKEVLLGEMAERFGPQALQPVSYHEANWSMQQWTRGCFTGFLTPGATVLFGSSVRDPVGPLHWAGTETATDWPSFIEGGIASGDRAATEVKRAL